MESHHVLLSLGGLLRTCLTIIKKLPVGPSKITVQENFSMGSRFPDSLSLHARHFENFLFFTNATDFEFSLFLARLTRFALY